MNLTSFLRSNTLTHQVCRDKITGMSESENCLYLNPTHCYGHDRHTFKIVDELSTYADSLQEAIHHPEKIRLFMDHYAPPPTVKEVELHDQQRNLAALTGCTIYEEGAGIGHQLALEDFISTGDVAIGIDTHICTAGALGALGLRNPYNIVARALREGVFTFYIPSIVKINLTGTLPPYCTGNEIIYHLAQYGQEKFAQSILEFSGPGLNALPVKDRITVANLSFDLHARSAIFATDHHTKTYYQSIGREGYRELNADEAIYDEVIDINLSELIPMVAFPESIFNVRPLTEITERIAVNHIVLGTCTNGRIEDYEDFLQAMDGDSLSKGTRLQLIISSRNILIELINKNLYKRFLELGAVINPPGCGSCMGLHQGVLGPNDVCAVTGSRNNKGRMGSEAAIIYLCNPKILGRIAKNNYISNEII